MGKCNLPKVRSDARREFQSANLLDTLSVTKRQGVEPELAGVRDVRRELGEYLEVRHAHKVDVERRIPRANQRLGDRPSIR